MDNELSESFVVVALATEIYKFIVDKFVVVALATEIYKFIVDKFVVVALATEIYKFIVDKFVVAALATEIYKFVVVAFAPTKNIRLSAVTFWSVESYCAKTLSVDFFKQFNQIPKQAAALRAIKLRMLHGKEGRKYKRPYYWAPFVVYGDAQ
jgi:hypothetical protein